MFGNNDGREETPVPTVPQVGTLGRLTLIKRKGGADVQTFPLDAERITFGRDYDCDVRLYYSDVSKLHCEINFDLLSGQATLQVHGSNGVLHTPAGGSATMHKPPATIPLTDNDLITIRKKPFRFEYGPNEIINTAFLSPAVHSSPLPSMTTSPSKAQSSAPTRRRASHRLSLVPAGKTFIPLSPAKNRRHSALGLTAARTPAGKSKLSEMIPQEEEEEEDNQSIIDVANGEEGDVVYLESAQEVGEESVENTHKPIHENPFMTPQQTRKTALRNTSAVPRTRKLMLSNEAPVETPTELVEEPEHPEIEIEIEAPDSPATPRSIPLPPVADTPYNPPATPAPKISTPVPAYVALSTPKGPATLRKALLLRSARKVWEESRASGIDGAIQTGDVETRRKSTSPRRKSKSGRKSATPVPEVQEPQVDEAVEEEEALQPAELEWINEEGMAEKSFDSDSSGLDSLEADMSLDMNAQGSDVLLSRLSLQHGVSNEQDAPVEEEAIIEDEQMEEDAHDDEQVDVLDAAQDHEEDHAEPDIDHEMEDEEDDMAMSLPGTPHVRQPLSTNFFTPQPQRNIARQPRRSLASIGGPAVRFDRLPATPGSKRGMLAPPGSMGKPSRRITVAAEPTQMKEEDDVKVFATPRKSGAAATDFKRHHEALATPRTLPAPPMSGFKDPVRETRFAELVSAPVHRALAPHSPEPEEDEEEEDIGAVPATPMNDLKKRLNDIRRQSVQRQGIYDRRATVGFVLPQTPSNRPTITQSASYSVASSRQLTAQAPRTPIFPQVKRDTAIFPKLEKTPARAIASPPREQSPSSPEIELPSSPSTPSYTGVREMLKPAAISQTPCLAGIRNMFPPTPKEVASPSLTGVRDLLAEPSNVPATPNLAGVKKLFNEKRIPPTPAMEGLREMYEEDEEEDVDQALNTSIEEVPALPAARKVSQSKLPKLATSAAARSKRTAPATEPEAETTAPAPAKISKIPARRGRPPTAATATVKREETGLAEEPKSKPTRTRKAPETTITETPSRSTRAKRTASAEPEPQLAAQGSKSRSTRSKASAEPESATIAENEKEKTTRSRSTSSRAKKVDSTSAPSTDGEAGGEEKKSSVVGGAGRGSKRVLEQIEEQIAVEESVVVTVEKKSVSAPTRGKKTTTTSTIGKGKPEANSAPTKRRGRPIATDEEKEKDKENNEMEMEVPTVPKKRGLASGSKKEVTSGLPVATARTTRSRK